MKTQMKFQKIMCLLMIIMGALSAVYCLIYCSGGLAQFGLLTKKNAAKEGGWEPAVTAKRYGDFSRCCELYMAVQPFNNVLLILSIIMIVAGAMLYITATNKRRNYYISNYLAAGVVSVFDIVVSIYVLIKNTQFYNAFKSIISEPVGDYMKSPTTTHGAYRAMAEKWNLCEYVTSGWNFQLGYFIYIVIIAASVLLILNCVWKFMLMRGEKQLLNGDTVKGVA